MSSKPVRARIADLWRRRGIRRIAFGFAAIQCVIVYGVLGFRMMGWAYSDAFYQVVIIISGVGLGEVHPLDDWYSRTHTIIVVALGISSVAFTLAAFIQALTESELLAYFGRNGR